MESNNIGWFAKTIAILVILVCVITVVSSIKFNKTDQMVGPGYSGVIQGQEIPAPTGFVKDDAEVISEAMQEQIENTLKAYAATDKGEIAIYTVKSLNGLSIEELGIRVGEQWKVGKTGLDNGAIIIIATQDRKARIELGRGSLLSDAEAGRILTNDMVPSLKENNWEDAITKGIISLTTLLNSK